MTDPSPRVAFLGLGMMGRPLALQLLKHGTPVAAFNRTSSKGGPVAAAGGLLCASPAEAAQAAEAGVVFTCLTDGKAVARALFGRGGAARAAPAGSLFVDLSTIAPRESRELGAGLREHGHRFVDAPVGGSIDAAARGEVIFYAGGEPADVDRARPYLAQMGKAILPTGPVGSGTSTKLVNNLLTLAHLALLGEGLALGESLGLERAPLLDALAQGGAQSRMLDRKRANLAARTYEPMFVLRLAIKDLGLVERSGKDGGLSMRLTQEVRRLYQEAGAQGLGEQDFSAVVEAARARRRPSRGSAQEPVAVQAVDRP